MTELPERLWCFNFQGRPEAWGEGWGGYARPNRLFPLDAREQASGGIYVREDLPVSLAQALRHPVIADVVQALRRAAIEGWPAPNAMLLVNRAIDAIDEQLKEERHDVS